MAVAHGALNKAGKLMKCDPELCWWFIRWLISYIKLASTLWEKTVSSESVLKFFTLHAHDSAAH